MSQSFKITQTQISYTVKQHARAKRVSIRISSGGEVTVTIPKRSVLSHAHTFVEDNRDWIVSKIDEIHRNSLPKTTISKEMRPQLKVKARNLIRKRIEHYNRHYQFSYLRLTIRDQKTRWGSCSSNKTLSFNFRLALLPLELVDYVVVHELCHLKEMNHSRKFWLLVAQTLPHYPILRKQLRLHEGQLM